MKNIFKHLSIIALVALIGFSMVSCPTSGPSGTNNNTNPVSVDEVLGNLNSPSSPPSESVLQSLGITDQTQFNTISADCLGWETGSIIIYWKDRTKEQYEKKIAEFTKDNVWTQAGNEYVDPDGAIHSTRLTKDTNSVTVDYLDKEISGTLKSTYVTLPKGFMRVVIGEPKNGSFGGGSKFNIIEPTFGKLTITGLDSYNGKYVSVGGGDDDKSLVCYDGLSFKTVGNSTTFTYIYGKIINNSVVVKVWGLQKGTSIFSNYIGNDKIKLYVSISETASPNGGSPIASGEVENVQFTNGVATVTNPTLTEVTP